VEGAVEERSGLLDQDVEGVLDVGRLLEPAPGAGLVGERLEGADDGRERDRQRVAGGIRVGPARPAPAAARPRRRVRRRWITAMALSASAITTNETAVVSVPSAYSAGEVTLVVIAQISRGSVLRLPIGIRVRGNSS
jgi:hypothetical protein